MGLENSILEGDNAEKRRFDKLKSTFTYKQFRRFYPDDFGRIDCNLGFFMSHEKNHKISESLQFNVEAPCDSDKSTSALDLFKYTVHLIYKLRLARGRADKIENIKRQCWEEGLPGWLKNDPDYLKHCIESDIIPFFYGKPIGLEGFHSMKPVKDLFTLLTNKKGKVRMSKVLEFSKRADQAMYDLAQGYFGSLEEFVDFWKFDEVADSLKDSLKALREHLKYERKRRFVGTNIRHHDVVKVIARLNSPAEKIMVNEVNCCITSNVRSEFNVRRELRKHVTSLGQYRDASILYCLDPSVHVWTLSADCELDYRVQALKVIKRETFGLGIFVEAKGYHHSAPNDPHDYLVLEGFPANDFYCESIGNLVRASSEIRNCSLSQAVYFLGLRTAKQLGVQKLFINTQHSGSQRSVDEAVLSCAREARLPADVYKIRKRENDTHPEVKNYVCKLVKDHVTGQSFPHIEVEGHTFEYSHFLQKKPLPPDVIAIQRDPRWCGQEFFDTFYPWNDFLNTTYDKWPSELKQAHQQAVGTWPELPKGLPSAWNLGIGYCKGFEVDVKKECERLGIS